ncbi:hypothetical protein F5887DRAFT_945007 [Amanita rubescens]|nr:hypothetical protein F5887DRAFT_945007 [Amanita rubescens]
MPSAASDHAALSLNAIHLIAFRNESVRLSTSAIPRKIHAVAAPDLVLSLSGTHDRAEIPAKVMAQSHIANHLVQYLRMNAAQLGLDYVSGIVHDNEDSKPKLVIRSGRTSSLQLQRLPTCATLIQIELAYIWQTSSQKTKLNVGPLTDPFSQILSLPYQTLLGTVVERFVISDLVKRYPFIFGPWHRQLDIEASFFPVIYRSISGIVDRSPNLPFKEKCGELFMVLRENLISKAAQSAASLSKALDAHDISIDPVGFHTSMSELDILCLAMEHLFQDGMPPPKFKGSKKSLGSDRVEDEELSQKMSEGSPDGVPEPRQNVLWELHSEDAPNDTSDSMDYSVRSSYERFPFGLYESDLFRSKTHQNKDSKDRGLSSPIEDYFHQWKGDIQSLGSALMTDDDTDNLHLIESWPVGACDEASEHEPLFALDEMQDSASGSPTCDEWTTENLFAHEEPEGNRSTSNFSGCGPGILDTDNDIDLLSEASTESTSSILNLEP